MTLLQAALLGIVQGVTEWLPVSSTAHLVLVTHAMGWSREGESALAFDVLVQVGTVLAAVVYFRADFARILRATARGLREGRPLESPDARLGWWIVLGTIPLLAAGLALRGFVADLHGRPAVIAWVLVGATPLLFLGERARSRRRPLEEARAGDAIGVGLWQAIAIVPGVSRSAATIAGGMLLGLDREAAARYSFLLAVPALLAAGAVEAWGLARSPEAGPGLDVILTGAAAAAVTGYLTIHLFLGYIRRRPLTDFAWYRLLAGGGMLLLL